MNDSTAEMTQRYEHTIQPVRVAPKRQRRGKLHEWGEAAEKWYASIMEAEDEEDEAGADGGEDVWCEARERGEAHLGMDPLAKEGMVYATTNRLYAKHYASLYGRGDLYGVEGVEPLERSDEDTVETWRGPALRVTSVLDRAVLLTDKERRRLLREWTAADLAADQRRAVTA